MAVYKLLPTLLITTTDLSLMSHMKEYHTTQKLRPTNPTQPQHTSQSHTQLHCTTQPQHHITLKTEHIYSSINQTIYSKDTCVECEEKIKLRNEVFGLIVV